MLFDPNQFKRSVKGWIRENPSGSENELIDFCEEQIPPAQYAAYKWLVDHTVSWYRHILASRKFAAEDAEFEEQSAI